MSRKPRKTPQASVKNETFASLIMPLQQEKLGKELGKRLKKFRQSRGFSLRLLAEKSGLSANTLSLIENAKTSPSIGTLQQISYALGLPINCFFEEEGHHEPVIYTQKNQRVKANFSHGSIEELGSGVGEKGLQPIEVFLEPKTNSGTDPLKHEGSEFVYCLKGRVVYTILSQEYVLEPGDSLLFSSKSTHSWHNPLDEETELIIVFACSADNDVSPRVNDVFGIASELSTTA